MREAQALARLSHPNIVQVYEAGADGDELYLAMELVRGVTLATWLSDQPRSRAEIVGMFHQIGQGLAAAHRAGLVHRDFKPSNVLVDAEGRARVVDFGLAALAERPDLHLGLAGTPAYMAPEQWLEQRVDPRTDQFSFCVALWEALAGARPFHGDSFDELRAVLLAGRLSERGRIPPEVHRALVRGLAHDPDARYPTLEALLVDLVEAPSRRRRRLAAGLAVAGVLGLGVGVSNLTAGDRCTGGEARLAGVWDDARREATRVAFLATGLGYAGDVWSGVVRGLDVRAAEIAAMHREACEAHARGEQSARLMDLRMTCLARHVQEVRAVTDLFVAADARIVEKAIDAVASLRPLARCADADALLADLPPPDDPTLLAAVEAVRTRLAELTALRYTRRLDASVAAADAAVRDAEATGYGPVIGEALLERGRLHALVRRHEAAELDFFAAYTRAVASGDDALARDAALLMIEALLVRASLPEAQRWIAVAGAALERSPDPGGTARLFHLRGELMALLDRSAEAEALLAQSIIAYDAAYGPDHLGSIEARVAYSDHLARGQHVERAREIIRDLLPRLERLYGPEHPALAELVSTEGLLCRDLGDYEAALASLRRSQALLRQIHSDDEDRLVRLNDNIALTLYLQGQLDDALNVARAALAAAERRLSPDDPGLVPYCHYVAKIALEVGDTDTARTVLDRYQRLLESNAGLVHLHGVDLEVLRGEWYRRTGDPAAAVSYYERALELRSGRDELSFITGEAHDGLGRALWQLGSEPDRAREHLERARAIFVEGGAAAARALADHERWRAEEVHLPAP
jgi:tetratricopeptide (TPR) repeat protein